MSGGYVPRKLRDRSGATRGSSSRRRDDRESDRSKASGKTTDRDKPASKKSRQGSSKPGSKRRPSPRGNAPRRPSPKARVPLSAYRRRLSIDDWRRYAFRMVIATAVALVFVAVTWVGSGESGLQLAGIFGRSTTVIDEAKKDTRTAASAMYSYDYRTFSESLANGKAFTTDAFAKEYDKTMEGLRKPATKEKAIVEAEVLNKDVATIETDATCSPKGGPAIEGGIEFLAFVNQTVKNKNIEGSRVDESRVVMCMVPTDSGWKVANTEAI